MSEGYQSPVAVALAAGAEAARRSLYPGMCRDGACMMAPCQCAHDAAAAAIAAFLRALPAVDVMMDRPEPNGPHSTRTLARAVEEHAAHA